MHPSSTDPAPRASLLLSLCIPWPPEHISSLSVYPILLSGAAETIFCMSTATPGCSSFLLHRFCPSTFLRRSSSRLCTSDRFEAVLFTASATDATATHARTRAPVRQPRLSVHDPGTSRRSGPRTHTRRVPMEVEADGTQEATAGAGDGGVHDVFFCVAATSRGNRNNISCFHTNAVGKDAKSALELAELCLGHAPEHHRWHHHTVDGARTFAFLSADDGCTYFAAADPTPGAAEVVRFLERVRDACDAAPRKRLRDEAVAPVARQFARTLLRTAAGPSSGVADAELPGASLAPACEKDEGHQRAGERRRALQPGESALPGWRSWWRHAAVVIVVDVVLCLVLFAVWIGVCKGFRCLTR